MSILKDSLRMKESLSIEDGGLLVSHNSGHVKRIIGEVTVEEYDALGNLVSRSVDHNDITPGGAAYILEQMFKIKSTAYRYNCSLATSDFNINETEVNAVISDTGIDDSTVGTERIVGFMIGIGGENASGIIAPAVNTRDISRFIPFRIFPSNNVPDSFDEDDYALKLTTTIDNVTYDGYYAKKFSNQGESGVDVRIKILSENAATSDIINTSTDAELATSIYNYASIQMDIDGLDAREYFNLTQNTTQNCLVNQIGLVSAKVDDTTGAFSDFRLVTILNFRTRYLNNSENTLKFKYKLYCM